MMSSDEILGHVDRALSSLPPEAQAAVSHAHSLAGLSQPEMLGTTGGTSQPESIPPVAQTPSSSEPINGPVSIPPETPTHGGPSDEMEIPPESATPEAPNQPQSIPPVSTSENGEIADLDRAQPSNPASAIGQPARIPSAAQAELKRRETTGSGVSQIKSPWARIPLQIADAVGSGLFPGIAQFIPGTSAKHVLQDVPQAERAVADEANQAKAVQAGESEQAKTEHEKAQAKLANQQADTMAEEGKRAPKGQFTDSGRWSVRRRKARMGP